MVDYTGLENRRAERHRGFEFRLEEFPTQGSSFVYKQGSAPPVGSSCYVLWDKLVQVWYKLL